MHASHPYACVQPPSRCVLDLRHLRKQGLEHTLDTELYVSYRLHVIGQQGRCPHFLSVYTAFQCAAPPPGDEWGELGETSSAASLEGASDVCNATDFDQPATSVTDQLAAELAALDMSAAAPLDGAAGSVAAKKGRSTRPPAKAQCYQYIMMEFAEGGDMEEACKVQPKLQFALEMLPCLIYQMLFALYSAQREVRLRHYDVKLLNFFLSRVPATKAAAQSVRTNQHTELIYGVCGVHHRFALERGALQLCKLADFGTSDLDEETYGAPIGARHLTTLENTPPDFLLLGVGARKGFKADAFALGLCWLHLLTGRAPYEEIVEALRCPAELVQALEAVWCDSAASSPYAPIRELIEADDDDVSVLYHTLYRFVCLFGRPDAVGGACTSAESGVCASPAWRAVSGWLESAAGRARFAKDHATWSAPLHNDQTRRATDNTDNHSQIQPHSPSQFQSQSHTRSIFHGKNKQLVEAQRRMSKLPGAADLLRGLVCFEPSVRFSVRRALQADVFAPYQLSVSEAAAASTRPHDEAEHTLHYIDYFMDAADDPAEEVIA